MQSWRAASSYWPRPSLSWLKRQRWLLRHPVSGQWLVNLCPAEQPGTWQAQWTTRRSLALKYATEEMGVRMWSAVQEKLGEALELQAVTFVAPPSNPTAWQPLEESDG